MFVAGRELSRLPDRKVPQLRREIGTVFQDFRLLPNKTVFQNVAFALQVIGKSRSVIRQTVPETLRIVGLEGKEKRLPHELSGGEQQRVAIARAIVNKPAILLADEPTGNLDPGISLEIVGLLDRINRSGTTIVMATHDLHIVNAYRKRVIELKEGRVVRDDMPAASTTPARSSCPAGTPGPRSTPSTPSPWRRPATRRSSPTPTSDADSEPDGPDSDELVVVGAAKRAPDLPAEDATRPVAVCVIGFLLGEIGNGLRRNVSMVVSVVLVTMISMYLLGLGLLAQRQVDTMKDYWYDRVQVSIFLCVDKSLYPNCAGAATTPAQRDALKAQLEQMKPPVKEVFYETQGEAYQRFKDQFRNSPLGEQATERAFADSFRVSLTDASKFDVIASSFQGAPGVGKVQDQKQLLDKFFTFMNVVSWSAIALAVLMVLCATLLMATTIRQTAFSRRRETGIMRLVGASNSTIQLPFIMETVVAAVVGAGLAMTLLYATVRYGVSGYLSTALIDTAFIGVPDVVAIAPWVIGGVVGLAVLTSGFTLRRYLRV